MLSTACCWNPGQLLSTLRGKGSLWIINTDGLRLDIPCNCELIPLKAMARKLWWSIGSTEVAGGYKTLVLGERGCIAEVQPVLWPHQAQLASAGKQRRQPTARSPFADAALFLSVCGREKMRQAPGNMKRGKMHVSQQLPITGISAFWSVCSQLGAWQCCLQTVGRTHPTSLMLWLEAA